MDPEMGHQNLVRDKLLHIHVHRRDTCATGWVSIAQARHLCYWLILHSEQAISWWEPLRFPAGASTFPL